MMFFKHLPPLKGKIKKEMLSGIDYGGKEESVLSIYDKFGYLVSQGLGNSIVKELENKKGYSAVVVSHEQGIDIPTAHLFNELVKELLESKK